VANMLKYGSPQIVRSISAVDRLTTETRTRWILFSIALTGGYIE